MKILRIPAVFSGNFPFFKDLSNHCFFRILFKKNSYCVPTFGDLLHWRGLIANTSFVLYVIDHSQLRGQVLGLWLENLKSPKMIDKLYSSCMFLIQTFFLI